MFPIFYQGDYFMCALKYCRLKFCLLLILIGLFNKFYILVLYFEKLREKTYFFVFAFYLQFVKLSVLN